MKKIIREFMETRKGYIATGNLSLLELVLRGERIISEENFGRITARAQSLIDSGIPPIYPAETFQSAFRYMDVTEDGKNVQRSELYFPVVDFIVQFAIGKLERCRAAVAVEFANRSGGKRREAHPVQPATANDILQFRKIAFTSEGKINDLLVREVLHYVETHFQMRSKASKANVLENDRQVFAFLEETLRAVPCEPMQYLKWKGDLSVVNDSCWHLYYRPEQAIEIAKAYFQSFQEKPKHEEKKTFNKMRAIFPEISGDFDKEVEKRQAAAKSEILKAIVATGNYRELPLWAAEEIFQPIWVPLLDGSFRAQCRHLRPEALLGNINELVRLMPIPYWLPKLPHFRAIINQERFIVAQTLDDGTFRRIFCGNKLGGLANKNKDGVSSEELRQYVGRRYHELSKS